MREIFFEGLKRYIKYFSDRVSQGDQVNFVRDDRGRVRGDWICEYVNVNVYTYVYVFVFDHIKQITPII